MYDRTTGLLRSKAIVAPPSPPWRRTNAQDAKFPAPARTALGMGALFHLSSVLVKRVLTECSWERPRVHFELLRCPSIATSLWQQISSLEKDSPYILIRRRFGQEINALHPSKPSVASRMLYTILEESFDSRANVKLAHLLGRQAYYSIMSLLCEQKVNGEE